MDSTRLERIRAATEEIPDLSKIELLEEARLSGESGYYRAFQDLFQVNVRPSVLHGRFERAQVQQIGEAVRDLCRRFAEVVYHRPELNERAVKLGEFDELAGMTRSPLGLSMTVECMANDIGNTVAAKIRAILEHFSSRFSDDETTKSTLERIKRDLPGEVQTQNALILEFRGYMPAANIEQLRHYFEARIANVYVGQMQLLDALQVACAKVSDSSQPLETIVATYTNKNGQTKDIVINCNPKDGHISLVEIISAPKEQIVQPSLINCVRIGTPPRYKALA